MPDPEPTRTTRPNRRRRTARCAEPAEPARLDALARLLADGVADTGTPTLVGVVGIEGDDADLHLGPLDRHPAEALRGFTAPSDWDVIGFAGGGTARSLVDDGPGSGPATIVQLCARTGDGWHRVTVQGLTLVDAPVGCDPDEHQGLVPDVLRRCLGLPTAPFRGQPGQVWAAVWVEQVVAMALRLPAPTLLRWDDVAGLAPRWLGIDADHPWPGGGWTSLVAAVTGGHLRWLGFEPDDATWFDEGSLGRAVLAALSPLEELLDAADELLSPAVAGRLRRLATSEDSPRPRGSSNGTLRAADPEEPSDG